MKKTWNTFRRAMQGLRQGAAYLPRVMRLVWAAAGYRLVLWLVLIIILGLLPAITVSLMPSLVDGLLKAIRTTQDKNNIWLTVHPVAIPGLTIAGITLLTEILNRIASLVRIHQSILVKDHINLQIYRKSSEVDLAFYDSADNYNHLYRAQEEASTRPLELLENLGTLLQNSITLVAMGATLLRFGAWLPLVLLIGTLPACFIVLYASTIQYDWQRRTTKDERRAWYYEWILMMEQSAAEVRLFGLGTPFLKAYSEIRGRLRGERIRLATKETFAELGAGILALLISIGALVWIVWQTLQGKISLGELTLFQQAFQKGQGLLGTLLKQAGQIYENCLYLSNLFEFLDLEATIFSPSEPLPMPTPFQKGIQLKNITFHYPHSERKALDGFDLEIPAGKIVAGVGMNGAGKSMPSEYEKQGNVEEKVILDIAAWVKGKSASK